MIRDQICGNLNLPVKRNGMRKGNHFLLVKMVRHRLKAKRDDFFSTRTPGVAVLLVNRKISVAKKNIAMKTMYVWVRSPP